jgi:hypothetical protein
MKPDEIILIVRKGGGNEYYTIPVHNYQKVIELVQLQSKL